MTRAGDNYEDDLDWFGGPEPVPLPAVEVIQYAEASALWRKRGWMVLPLPPGAKKAPPKGFTGSGRDPSNLQMDIWEKKYATTNSNLCLLPPHGVIGLDVDMYRRQGRADKGEPADFDDLDARTRLEEFLRCALPDTIMSTSRNDGSGIYLYQVLVLPAGEKWVSEPVPDVEIVQRTHRYAVTWPSIHDGSHGGGGQYRLIDTASGEILDRPPEFDQLAKLPDCAVEALRVRRTIHAQRDHVDFELTDGEMSPAVARTLAEALAVLGTNVCRHDATCAATCALVRLAERGDPGVNEALNELRSAFVEAIADRAAAEDAEREFADMVSGARRLVGSTEPKIPTKAERDQAKAIAAADAEDHRTAVDLLPDDFWSARPVLGHIRQAAHSRRTSGDAVLHGVLARVSALTIYTIELPPLVGSAASLNYFVAMIGASGVGKGSAVGVARELVEVPAGFDIADDRPIGSGEGIPELYYRLVPDPDQAGKKIRALAGHQAFIYVDEGEVLAELSDRKAATTVSTLRSAWSGQTLGQSNATTERTRLVPAGSYRLAMVVGFQPIKAAHILADDIGGTPQRFLWASAIDPTIPTVRPEWPGVLPWCPLDRAVMDRHVVGSAGGYNRHRMTVATSIADEIDAAHLARQRGEEVGGLDSHAHLHRLKVAGLLAILDGRMDVGEGDWRLAGMVWEVSCAVRAQVLRLVALEAERSESASVERNATRELVAEAARRSAPARVTRLAARIARWVHEHPEPDSHPRRALLQRLKGEGGERLLGDAAIGEALAAEWIVEDGERFTAGPSAPA